MAQSSFQEISASDFFYRNRDIAGFTNPSRAIFAAIRELVENSLDAAESLKIPPDIYVRLSAEGKEKKDEQVFRLRVEDNGSGIQPRFIPSAFRNPISEQPAASSWTNNFGNGACNFAGYNPCKALGLIK